MQLLTSRKAQSQEVAMEEDWNKKETIPSVVWSAMDKNGGSHIDGNNSLLGGRHSSSDEVRLTDNFKSSFRRLAMNRVTANLPTSSIMNNNRALARKRQGPS